MSAYSKVYKTRYPPPVTTRWYSIRAVCPIVWKSPPGLRTSRASQPKSWECDTGRWRWKVCSFIPSPSLPNKGTSCCAIFYWLPNREAVLIVLGDLHEHQTSTGSAGGAHRPQHRGDDARDACGYDRRRHPRSEER